MALGEVPPAVTEIVREWFGEWERRDDASKSDCPLDGLGCLNKFFS